LAQAISAQAILTRAQPSGSRGRCRILLHPRSSLLQPSTMAPSVTINGDTIDPRSLPTLESLTAAGISYVQGTKSNDTCRFATTKGLPLVLTFTDRHNHEYKVQINEPHDSVTFAFPGSPDQYWWGDEKDRTGFDGQTHFIQTHFSYQGSSMFHSHGIRLNMTSYSLNEIGEKLTDTENWNNVLDLAAKGAEIAKTMAEVVETVKGGGGDAEDAKEAVGVLAKVAVAA